MEKLIKFIVCAAIILATFKFAGDMDRTEHAIMLMSDTEYEEIKDSLSNIHNSEPSEKQIANEWYSRKGNYMKVILLFDEGSKVVGEFLPAPPTT